MTGRGTNFEPTPPGVWLWASHLGPDPVVTLTRLVGWRRQGSDWFPVGPAGSPILPATARAAITGIVTKCPSRGQAVEYARHVISERS